MDGRQKTCCPFWFMKIILLKRGLKAKIDDEDYNLINNFKWNISLAPSNKIYAITTQKEFPPSTKFILRVKHYKDREYRYKLVFMHWLILGFIPKNKEVDHINGNGLDNRRENLRIVTHHQNMMNKKIYKNNKVGVKGIVKYGNKYRARITLNGKKIHLGMFNNLKQAKIAYQNAANLYFGKFANYE